MFPQHPRMTAQLREISLEYTVEELEIATLRWHKSRTLGSGSYGAVFKGELPDGSEVAIKAINLAALGAQSESAGFEEEVTMLSKFRHPNLVTLLGWGKSGHMRYLVYELLGGGDAFKRLAKTKQPQPHGILFHWHERLSVVLDAATGLSHMHNSKPKAFHRDIKSANILLDRHGTAKMADFGLSCTNGLSGDLHVTVKSISGTPGYACPIYSRTGRVTEGSEVYSFGMVMLELLVNLAPASPDPHKPGGIIYPIRDHVAPAQPNALERCIRQLDPSAGWPQQLAVEFATLALRCVDANNERARPSFVELVRAVRQFGERFPKDQPASNPYSFASNVPQLPARLGGPSSSPHHGGGRIAVEVSAQPVHYGAATPPPPAPNRSHDFGDRQGSGRKQSQPNAAQAGLSSRTRPVQVAVENMPDRSRKYTPAALAEVEPAEDSEPSANEYAFDLLKAVGVDVASLPMEHRRLALVAGPPDSPEFTATVRIGRQHQADIFEAWLPDLTLRNCISRTAFQVSWTSGGNFQITIRGANPVVVDGQATNRATPVSARLGSDVGFTYTTGSSDVFLLLRLVSVAAPLSTPSWENPVQAAGNHTVSRREGASTPGASSTPGFPGRCEPRRIEAEVVSRRAEADAAPPPPPEGRSTNAKGGGPARLMCVYTEGLDSKALEALPVHLKSIELTDGGVHVGRQHQPTLFEALLSSTTRCMSFISRSHAQVDVTKVGITVTNLSSNPLYVDFVMLSRGESKHLGQDSTLSFARMDTSNQGNQIHFLQLKMQSSYSMEAFASGAGGDTLQVEQEVTATAPRELSRPSERQPEERTLPRDQPLVNRTVEPPSAVVKPPRKRSEELQELLKPRATATRETKKWEDDSFLTAPSPSKDPGEPMDSSMAVMELCGEGTLSVPESERRIGPLCLRDGPLFIGRKYQTDLHKRVVSPDCLQFVSREHFQISFAGGGFRLKALTSNPIWRDVGDGDSIEVCQNESVPLNYGDRIILGTGSSMVSAKTAGRKLYWIFRQPEPYGSGSKARQDLGGRDRKFPLADNGPPLLPDDDDDDDLRSFGASFSATLPVSGNTKSSALAAPIAGLAPPIHLDGIDGDDRTEFSSRREYFGLDDFDGLDATPRTDMFARSGFR